MDEKKKVLLMDDDPEICRMIEARFQGQNLVTLLPTAHTGRDANELIGQADAVLDLIVPEEDGISVLERIITMPAVSRPEVIIISTFASDELIRYTLSLGARFFLAKPFSADNLYKRVLDVLGDRERPRMNHSIAPAPASRSIDERITSVFLTVGIPAHIKGYQYLRAAIKLVMKDEALINRITRELYPRVAEQFGTSASKVERAIRHAIEVAWTRGKIENINRLFGYQIYTKNEKPTNGEFIALVADKLILEQSA